MTEIPASTTWSADALGEMTWQLASRAGWARRTGGPPPASLLPPTPDASEDAALDGLADYVGVEAESIEAPHGEVGRALSAMRPGVVRLTIQGRRRYLAVLSASARSLSVLTPELSVTRVPVIRVRDALCASLESMHSVRVDRWLSVGRAKPRRAAGAHTRILREVLAGLPVGGMWVLRPSPGASFGGELARRGALRRLGLFVLLALAQTGLSALGWVLIGRGALDGTIDRGWLYAWVLAALSAIPLQISATWISGRTAIDVACLLKQRLLLGAMRIAPEEIRVHGSGALLGMVNESEAIETAGLEGALGAVMATLQLVGAGAVLLAGAGGMVHVLLLVGWTSVVAWLAARFARKRGAWTRLRLTMTNSFVENVVGNRTRVAQEPREERHVREDSEVARYVESSRAMDAARNFAMSVPARGWLALASVGLTPSVAFGGATPASLAVTIGGILLAQSGFAGIIGSATQLLGAGVAWQSIGGLFRAAVAPPPAPVPAHAVASRGTPSPEGPVLAARRVTFRYRERVEPALAGCDLIVRKGDRVLIEGPSGGGKSTLAAVLTGMRSPSSGLVLLRGLDPTTLGESAWRRRVASAPQFHENHILCGTMAFNLLMGREWPPAAQDKDAAEALCRELGLGPLIDRMPSGLDQVVGETGWQLSHGERSRVFLARALLQRSDVVVLDESFGALDPLTLRQCVDAVLARAPSLVVIAHP